MSNVIVYTIDNQDMVVDQFECEREHAINTFFGKHNQRGRYLIANITDDIQYKWRRKPLKDIKINSSQKA